MTPIICEQRVSLPPDLSGFPKFHSLTHAVILGPNERRTIARESLGFYRALVIGGIYEFGESTDIKSAFTYSHALRACVDRHPELSITVVNPETESPYYAFCPQLDLSRHIQFLKHNDESERESIQRILPSVLDVEFPASLPPWKIVILPFSDKRCFIAFSYSHTLGDGISAMAFHRTFLTALQAAHTDTDLTCMSLRKTLRPAFDTPHNLPISWSYLLSPLLGAYLPKPIARLFGFRPAASAVTPGTWTGASTFHTADTFQTGVHILSLDAATVTSALQACRPHGAKMTGLLHQLIITALSDSLPRPHTIDSFSAQTAINLRATAGVSNDEMGLFVTGDYALVPLQKSIESAAFDWTLAKTITEKLAIGATKLEDQPIGLLQYLTDIRAWTLSKLGARRDGSYEVSNLLVFKPLGEVKRCKVTEMVFCQPANVPSSPLCFNVVSAVDGPMNITLSWQIGALGVGEEKDEKEFVRVVCDRIQDGFTSL